MSLVLDRPPAPAPGSPPPPAPGASPTRPRRRWNPVRLVTTESGLVCSVAFVAYLTAAIVLAFVFQIMPLDAVSRMANGYYVIWSRDPHLAAVGFAWSPLQSFADIPFLLFKPLFPVLATHDLAGSLVSVLAGVGAVHQIHAALREWGVRRAPRLILTLMFAANPMILYYAANGMSDMLLIFLLAMSTRYLLMWLRSRDLRSLVYAGSALGLAYLDRYEALGAAALATLVVLVMSFQSAAGARRGRAMTALTDATIFALPVVTTFVAWATASYVIVKQWFPGFTTTTSATSQATPMDLANRVMHGVHNLAYLAPLLPQVLVIAVALSVRKRNPLILAPLAVLGGSLAFDGAGLVVGFIEPWYRYFIMSVALDVMLVGCILASFDGDGRARANGQSDGYQAKKGHRRTKALAASAAGVAFALLVLGPSLPLTGKGIFASSVQSSESTELGALFLAHPTLLQRQWTHHFAHILSIDHYIGAMHLGDGQIVADTDGNCTPQIVTSVPNSKVFVITNDRDFQRVVASPLTFGAHYLLVPQPVGAGVADPLNIEYPTLYDTGAGFAKLVHQFNSDGQCAVYRLYRVTGTNGQT